jgi:nucleophosmin 3
MPAMMTFFLTMQIRVSIVAGIKSQKSQKSGVNLKFSSIFPGATLKSAGESVAWDPEKTDGNRYPPRNHKLILKQAVLGHEATEGYNVVQAETVASSTGNTIRIPIAVLKAGETRHCVLDLEFPEGPVTFTLTSGSGPVYLHGTHILGAEAEDGDDGELGEEELMDEEECEGEEEFANKKAKLAANNKGKPVPAVAKSAAAATGNNKKK